MKRALFFSRSIINALLTGKKPRETVKSVEYTCPLASSENPTPEIFGRLENIVFIFCILIFVHFFRENNLYFFTHHRDCHFFWLFILGVNAMEYTKRLNNLGSGSGARL